MAEGARLEHCHLQSDCDISFRREVWTYKSDSAMLCVGRGKYRGRVRARWRAGLSAVPTHSTWLGIGAFTGTRFGFVSEKNYEGLLSQIRSVKAMLSTLIRKISSDS